MTVKLNITIDEDVALRSKRYAAKKKTSVSRIIENYLNEITKPPKVKKQSFVEKYAGILKGKIPDINKAKDEYLKEKYGL